MLIHTLPLVLAMGLQSNPEIPCSKTDLIHGHCVKKPYCPGQEADERIQRHLFTHFMHTLYDEKNVSKAFETYVSPNIIEHDPDDTQNRDAIVARLEGIIPSANLTILQSSFGDSHGLIYLKVEADPEPKALADIYRMHRTCIVEHWDVVQARPANSKNPIAMFWLIHFLVD